MTYESEATRRRKARNKKTGIALLGAAVAVCVGGWLLLRTAPERAGVPAAASALLPAQEAAAPMAEPFVVALDAGHGGADTGAAGLGRNESEVAQETVDALYLLLEADGNYAPMLCHTPEECPTTAQRSAAADKAGALLLLSVHANAAESTGRSGFECFAAPPGRAYHGDSLRFAHCIVDGLLAAGHTPVEQTGIFYMYFYEGSENLPTGYDRMAVPETDDTRHDNLVSFGMVDRPHCAAVLVEQGYMTSSADADWLSSEGCAAAARVYYEAVCAYFGTEPVPAS